MRARLRFSPIFAALAALLFIGTAHAAASTDSGPAPTINLNRATTGQLTFLPGIGSTKAERIVAYRAKHSFKSVVELARVKGIGLKTVRKLKPWLRVSGPTTLAGPVRVPKAKRPRAASGR